MNEFQFNDFLTFLSDAASDCVDFFLNIHGKLTQMGCKVKMTSTKAHPYQLAYTMPNSRKGILNFYLRKKGLRMRITVVNADNHAHWLNSLPAHMVNQISKKNTCVKLTENCECLDTCMGFDFYINENHFQKCRFYCFQFDVDAESMPYFYALLEGELMAREQKGHMEEK